MLLPVSDKYFVLNRAITMEYTLLFTWSIPSLRIIVLTNDRGNRLVSLPLNISHHMCPKLPISGMHKVNYYTMHRQFCG